MIDYSLEQAMGTIAQDARQLLEAELQGDLLIDPKFCGGRPDTAQRLQTDLLLRSLKAHRALKDYSHRRTSYMLVQGKK